MAIVAVMLWLGVTLAGGTARPNTAAAADPAPGAAFNILDQNGRAVSEAALKAKPSIVHFGFTRCPDICPTTLYELGEYLRDLGDLAGAINVVFVTADPERDTPAVLKDYLASFDPRIIGLTGGRADVERLAASLGAEIEKRQLRNGDYTIDHSVVGYVMARGWLKTGSLFLGYGSNREQVLRKLRGLAGAED